MNPKVHVLIGMKNNVRRNHKGKKILRVYFLWGFLYVYKRCESFKTTKMISNLQRFFSYVWHDDDVPTRYRQYMIRH